MAEETAAHAEPLGFGTDPEVAIVLAKTGAIRSPHDIVVDPANSRNERFGAVGVDGNRPTSPIELRPGVSASGEELVNRLADLFGMVVKHYHPRGIRYRAGAYIQNPGGQSEPLGFHIHLGWRDPASPGTYEYNLNVFRVMEVISGWQAMADYLVPRLFLAEEVAARIDYAKRGNHDFALPLTFRPKEGLSRAISDRHIEFRFLPSCMQTPEAAYCALGGAEIIAKEVFGVDGMKKRDWPAFVAKMYTDAGVSPVGSPPVSEALDLAVRYVDVPDIANTWVG